MLRLPATLAELIKLPITLLVTLTAASGYVLFARRLDAEMAPAVAGTLLAAAASSALNHLQEAHLDARMLRTTGRPLPTGRLSPASAGFLAAILSGLAFAALASSSRSPFEVMGLAALAMAWYNGLYTYLKRVTAFAVVPGALIGAVPPVIGWVSAGGRYEDPVVWVLAGFFFLWQVPHFWLIMLIHGDDYARAGLPTMAERLGRDRVCRMTWAWVLATAVAGTVTASIAGLRGLAFGCVAAASVGLGAACAGLARGTAGDRVLRNAFRWINAYALLFTALVIAASLAG